MLLMMMILVKNLHVPQFQTTVRSNKTEIGKTAMNFSCGQEKYNQLNITENSVSSGEETTGTYELYKRRLTVRLGLLKIMRIRMSSKVL